MLQKQIYAILIITTVLISLLYGLILFPLEKNRYTNRLSEAETFLDVIITHKSNEIASQIFLQNWRALETSLQRLNEVENISSIILYDQNGKPLLTTGKDEVTNLSKSERYTVKDHHTFVEAGTPKSNLVTYTQSIPAVGGVIGYIRVNYSVTKIRHATRITQLTFSGLLVTILLSLTLIMSLFTRKVITKPLTMLANAMNQVKQGKLGVQVDVESTNEIGEISDVFNKMSLESAHIYQELANLNKSLEGTIQERTEELQQKNASLNTALIKADKMAEEADRANQAKSVFLANMSHELRTPLNAILGFTQILIHDRNLSKDQLNSLETINKSGAHLLILINDVLDMTKIESGHVTMNNSYFSPKKLVQDATNLFTAKASSKNLQLNVDVDSAVPQTVLADATRIRQVLLNLVGNAVKFTDEGSINVLVHSNIQVSSEEPMSEPICEIFFDIQDTGCGLSEDDLEEIFTPFVQVGNSQKKNSGTGLGLAISRKFVEMMGGTLTAKSNNNNGSVFSFSIKTILAENSVDSEKRAHQKIIGIKEAQKTFRALIVDDNQVNRQLLISFLKPIGIKLKEAIHGEEAVLQMKNWQPDIIWMDMQMPVMDGHEATRKIRTVEGGDKVIIIGVSASAFEENRNSAIEAGCDDFIHKPIEENEIFRLLQDHLNIDFLYTSSEEDDDIYVDEITRIQLTSLPPDILEKLLSAARSFDYDAAVGTLSEIDTIDPETSRSLRHLIEQYRFDLILKIANTLQ